VRRLLATGVLVGAIALATGPLARAATPGVQQGWWTPAGALGLPATVAAPDVPTDGLLVEGGVSGPRTYAAVAGPAQEGGALVLDVAPSSVTTPDAPLQVCPLRSPTFTPAQGGPSGEAPEYDCARSATVVPANGRYRIDLTTLLVDGALAVALLPANATDRVALTAPTIEGSGAGAGAGADGDLALPSYESGGAPLSSLPMVDVAPAPAPSLRPAVARPPAARGSTPAFAPLGNAVPDDADPLTVGLTLVVGVAGAAMWIGARHAARAAVASAP
jgi:hypothetical protein